MIHLCKCTGIIYLYCLLLVHLLCMKLWRPVWSSMNKVVSTYISNVRFTETLRICISTSNIENTVFSKFCWYLLHGRVLMVEIRIKSKLVLISVFNAKYESFQDPSAQGGQDRYCLWHQLYAAVHSYSISQEICTRFCCALLCCGYAIVHNEFTWSIYPYSSGLLCWHWGNR